MIGVNMNWNEIKEKYPESWNKLREWRKYIDYCETQDDLGHYITDGVHRVGVWIYFNKRDLYDFFDEQHVYVVVSYLAGSLFMIAGWTYMINQSVCDRDFKTRIEAEEQAFLKAFEILEDRI